MVRTKDTALLIDPDKKFGRHKKEFLELLHGLCYAETMLASRNVLHTRNFWEAECASGKRMMPENLVGNLDVSSLEFRRQYQDRLNIKESTEQEDPYQVALLSNPFIEPCFAAAKTTAEILRHCLLGDQVLKLRKPHDKSSDQSSSSGHRVP